MDNKQTVTHNGIGFSSLLTVAFIVLKLMKIITWSWVWVLSPLWISAGLGILVLLVVLIITIIIAIKA